MKERKKRNDDEQAMQQFEALQSIDPDDLAAHDNLSILYRRMGMKKQAAEQQALFITRNSIQGRQHIRSTIVVITWRLQRKAYSGAYIQTFRVVEKGSTNHSR